eukprot:CAMPEP_0172566190 /NCGR_PEP_ID=MMETSP1067-20121228/110943_1 /TAXON_ID=265564 ORGANISM="Thalassiosira punctigera, Strain Tpunct2005C2" /NCGR_SAMPLE_ID=MMETSP1067 /ASSEMBLY_ACC=CAM_ASM_000444 /LENGTH=85 /DNA_ID=CAMNT_0013357241 /DNA_START=66 /DNA_END=320 /DNA_ORIENTATION=+
MTDGSNGSAADGRGETRRPRARRRTTAGSADALAAAASFVLLLCWGNGNDNNSVAAFTAGPSSLAGAPRPNTDNNAGCREANRGR